MNTKIIFCAKYAKDLPALLEAPLKGPIGELILKHVSAEAWQNWVEAQIKIINEERLDLSEIKAQERLFHEMIEYLGLGKLITYE